MNTYTLHTHTHTHTHTQLLGASAVHRDTHLRVLNEGWILIQEMKETSIQPDQSTLSAFLEAIAGIIHVCVCVYVCIYVCMYVCQIRVLYLPF
jgi:hypothetical protein